MTRPYRPYRSIERHVFDVGFFHHDAIDALLCDLEALPALYDGEPLPPLAERLAQALTAFLPAYGRRDQHGNPLMRDGHRGR